MSGSSKRGKKGKNPKGLPSPWTIHLGSRGDGRLIIEGKVFNCCVEDLKELNVLHHGLFGGTYQMIHKPTGHIMAVQRRHADTFSEYEQLLMDLDALANLNSPYLLHYYGALFREGEVWLCMELVRASLHDLRRRAYGTPGRRMPEEVIREIAIAAFFRKVPEYAPENVLKFICAAKDTLKAQENSYIKRTGMPIRNFEKNP